MNDRVIVTAISPNMWHDYLVFYDSIRRHHDYPIYVVCLEMLNWQLEALKKNHKNVHIITINPDLIEEYKKTDTHWRQWFKPYYFDLIPEHETVLWLDSDMVILESLDPLCELAETKFVVMADFFAPKTCLNKLELYNKFKLEIPKEKANIVLNSGVIGMQPARDKHIMKMWKRKVDIAAKDKDVRSWLALFDQGALLWALQELNLYHLIMARKAWNFPAKRNPYELVTDSTLDGTMVQCLPLETHVTPPEDLIENIRTDNPGAVVAHFAGLPKLAHLCEPNHQHSLTYFRRKNGGKEIRRAFILGLERAGTKTLAKVLRQSCTAESWVRYGLTPTLAAEAQAKHFGGDHRTHEFLERLELYARQDCGFVCEANKNLSYFVHDIHERLQGTARFIVMLRDPVSLIRSRFLNFVTWPDLLHKAPVCYQDDYRQFMRLGRDTSNNYFRLKPHKDTDRDLIDMHIWEVEHQLQELGRTLKELPPHLYKYVWVENMRAELFHLTQFLGGQQLDPAAAEKAARAKHGTGLKICSPETLDWVESQLEERLTEIYQRISAMVAIPFRGV
jgi:hypothetical protein